MRQRTRAGILGILALALLSTGVGTASATKGHNILNLAGGDRLEANAYHCGTYFSACSWENSAKVLGYNPAYADSVTNESHVAVHGIVLSISLGSTKSVGIIYTQSGLIASRWTNYNAWISDSSGIAYVSPLSTYVSSTEIASARDGIFGSPSGVTAYAGACC